MQPTTCWQTESFRRDGRMVLDMLSEFVDQSRRGETEVVRVRNIEDIASALGLDASFFEDPADPEKLESLLRTFLAGSTRLQHPGYMAHQVALPHYASALADLIIGSLNNGMSVYEMGPAASAMEIVVIDWLLSKVGWQPSGRNRSIKLESGKIPGGGVLTHGGSLANLTALLAARASICPTVWAEGVPEDLVVIAPENAHYSLSRALGIMGHGTNALLSAPTDSYGRIDSEQLAPMLDDVLGSGKKVMAVSANACATATGLYDPLQEVGLACRERGLWFHVDGAHGASALLSATEAHRLTGIGLADSVTWDAHKLLQTSTLCAAALFRDGKALQGAFQQDATYVTEGRREMGLDVIEHQFECTKAPLGLKIVLVLTMIGERGMGANIDALFDATRCFYKRISQRAGFEVFSFPESNILCFRIKGGDELQTKIRQDLMKDGDFLLSQADIAGKRWLRLTIMNPLTDVQVIDRLLDTIEEKCQRSPKRA
ncbi:MAG: diaminobutyrate decarboxylase [bacterium]|nr:diaminobutyrate decarboxylase [bacterium]